MTQTVERVPAIPPAQLQSTGPALLDLNVTATPLVINWNRDAVNAVLDAMLEQYEGLVVQEEDVPAIKSEMAGLNKLAEKLDTARKDIKRQLGAPIVAFEDDVKAMTIRVMEVRAGLSRQVKAFERRDREGRRSSVQFVIDSIKDGENVPELDIPIQPSWLNKSTRQAQIHEEVRRIVAAYKLAREEAHREEQAQADRMALVEATVKAQAEQHGFALSLSRFAACLTPDISGEQAAEIIGQVYAAEAKAREEPSAPAAPPAQPHEPFIEPDEDFPFAPPVNGTHTLTLSIKYAPRDEETVQEALALLRSVALVTSSRPAPRADARDRNDSLPVRGI